MELARIERTMDRRRRSCGFDRNDLRRGMDRWQWFIGLLLLTAGIAVASVAAVHVSRAVYDSGVRAERREAAVLHATEATVVKVDETRSNRGVKVSWIAPDGSRRTGAYETWRGASVGDHVRVWAGPEGVREDPPRPHARTIGDTASYAVGTVAATAAVFCGAYQLVRRRFDRIRYRRWDAAWADLDRHRIGP
ncbi:Rv1733c family protein [Actinomadura nitritigenes]|uniref:DUF3592 domain-containing protein n=1 Tax=Actinomadura nitritigenes TaxID=134602 RepID=A0ABS3RGR8_9ACTN|nr:hypothetical protein [Actinomadura nitritigenes]MBO2445422.1 hypothetical protein [Actinomadura nitritigenes]